MMLKITFTPEFLEWVGQKMRANDTGLIAEEFAIEFMHRAYVGRGAIMAPASIAAENERLRAQVAELMTALKPLIYKCAVCNEMVTHDPGPHWLETGTVLFCPQCDGATIIILQRDEKQNEKARAALARTKGGGE